MTTEMFGAPFGIQQAEQGINQNVLSGLKAQQLLGEIAMQPAEMRLKEAHAQLYGAEAAAKNEQAAKMRQLDQISRQIAAETRLESSNREALIEEMANLGQIATVADLPAGGFRQPRSAAEPVEKFISRARELGLGEATLLPFIDKASLVRQHEAAAAHNMSQTFNQVEDTRRKQRNLVGSIAQGVLADPSSYQLGRMEALRQGVPPEVFPQEFDPQRMRLYVNSALTANEKADNDRELSSLDERKKLWKARIARDEAAVGLTSVRRAQAKFDYDEAVKYGGKNSPATSERQKELIAASKAKREAADRKEFPKVSLNPTLIEEGKNYTLPDGTKVKAIEKRPDGKWRFQELIPAPRKVPPRAAPNDDGEED